MLRTLGAVAEVLPGFSVGRMVAQDQGGTYQLIQSKHLTPGVPYRYREEDAFLVSPGKRARNSLVRHGDVLFMSRGTRNVASWLEVIPEMTLAVSSFYVIRPKPVLNPGYLTWYLNQPAFQRRIAEIRTGAGAPIVQRGALQGLQIPVPDLPTQVQLAELGTLMAREQDLIQSLAAQTTQLHDLTSGELARRLVAGELPNRSTKQ